MPKTIHFALCIWAIYEPEQIQSASLGRHGKLEILTCPRSEQDESGGSGGV